MRAGCGGFGGEVGHLVDEERVGHDAAREG
jgi:hypothetical protein